ncbi:MAG: hypothetical protein K2M94_01050 [Paramuribaculum sp.]|nr:hypothetical protein [Paramuribaculum sp.]
MKKIILLYTLLIMMSASVKAQTEVTPDMIWREGVTIKFYNDYIVDCYDGRTNTWSTEQVKGVATLVFVPEVFDDHTYMSGEIQEEINDAYYCCIGNEAYSFKRYEDGKIYGYIIDDDTWSNPTGKEHIIHDFDEWVDGNTITYYIPTFFSDTWYREEKIEITNLQKIYSPDGKYWSWGFNDNGKWHIKGVGSIDDMYSILVCNFESPVLGASIMNASKNVTYGMNSTVDADIRIVEIISPEGEIYFRHPDYTPDDDLGAIAAVTQDNSVNITGNAGEVCVTAAIPTDVEIFTAQGTKVYGASAVKHTTCKLQQGLYIVRAGSTAKKVAVK